MKINAYSQVEEFHNSAFYSNYSVYQSKDYEELVNSLYKKLSFTDINNFKKEMGSESFGKALQIFIEKMKKGYKSKILYNSDGTLDIIHTTILMKISFSADVYLYSFYLQFAELNYEYLKKDYSAFKEITIKIKSEKITMSSSYTPSSSSSSNNYSSKSSSSTSNSKKITKFPDGPSSFYKKNGLEITAFASCGSYVYGPKACYRIKNTNNYRIYFKIEMILNDGDIKEGYEHSISAGEQLEFEDRWSDIGLPGVSDIRIKYAR